MKKYKLNINTNKNKLLSIIEEIGNKKKLSDKKVEKIIRKYPSVEGKIFSKGEVIYAFNKLKNKANLKEEQKKAFIEKVKMKRVRTISGVAPITVLTKPFPCPGKCIFCPNDTKMPKSYLSDEPGAQRALSNKFDPFLQTHNRLVALKNIGHDVSKAEVIVLGGTWSSYPKPYQIWFIKRCFDALNNFEDSDKKIINPSKTKDPVNFSKVKDLDGSNLSETYNKVIAKAIDHSVSLGEKSTFSELNRAHKKNEKAKIRCVGLVIETRPDEIDKNEVLHLRKLGATKVQIGIQSLNDNVLKLNKRGHDSKQTAKAIKLLRQAGFKIQAHIMPNLYGSNVQLDTKDYKKLFSNKSFRPDEVKIYPCSLIKSAELYKYYKENKWKPYTRDELLKILTYTIINTPRYTRVTRMIRDIPSTDILVGNKTTNFRQIVETQAKKENKKIVEIRNREIKTNIIKSLKVKKTNYQTSNSKEVFLEYVNKNDQIAGFLRLSLPNKTNNNITKELNGCAIIREVHIYGVLSNVGEKSDKKAQHRGLGKKLIKQACKISKNKGFKKIAVISSIGTREYYEKRGFNLNNLYQIKLLK